MNYIQVILLLTYIFNFIFIGQKGKQQQAYSTTASMQRDVLSKCRDVFA